MRFRGKPMHKAGKTRPDTTPKSSRSRMGRGNHVGGQG